jgi:murein DD-endopeptidase MepM/ murein hydrolase activator NlpD
VRKPVMVLAILVLFQILFPAPARAEVTRDQLAHANDRLKQKSAEMEGRLGELEAAMYQEWSYQQRIAALQREVIDRKRGIALARFAAREQAVALYVNLGTQSGRLRGGQDDLASAGTRDAYMNALLIEDRDAVNELEYLQNDQSRLEAELQGLLVSQTQMKSELQAQVDQVMGELDAANQEYQALYSQWQREEAARQAAAAAASHSSAGISTHGRACPVAGGNTFRNSWGEPRPDGRSHHGVDMVAGTGTPLVAVESGVIRSPNYHYAGGIGLYLHGNSGDVYYYAHMNGYGPGIGEGSRVGAGQVVGYVGSTGNAAIPHLHLGYSPGGGSLANPYQLMVNLCR